MKADCSEGRQKMKMNQRKSDINSFVAFSHGFVVLAFDQGVKRGMFVFVVS